MRQTEPARVRLHAFHFCHISDNQQIISIMLQYMNKNLKKYNLETVSPQICDASVMALAQWDLHAHVQHWTVSYKIGLTQHTNSC